MQFVKNGRFEDSIRGSDMFYVLKLRVVIGKGSRGTANTLKGTSKFSGTWLTGSSACWNISDKVPWDKINSNHCVEPSWQGPREKINSPDLVEPSWQGYTNFGFNWWNIPEELPHYLLLDRATLSSGMPLFTFWDRPGLCLYQAMLFVYWCFCYWPFRDTVPHINNSAVSPVNSPEWISRM